MTPRDTTEDDRRLSRNQRGAFALIAVVCILLAGAAVVTAQQQSFSDDFEDGNLDGWEPSPESAWDVETLDGNGSLHGVTFEDQTKVSWDGGPLLDMGEEFSVEGTVRPQWNDPTEQQIRIGLSSGDTTAEGENAFILFDRSDGSTYLATFDEAEPPDDSSNKIGEYFGGEWVNFRIESVGDGELQATVWGAGDAEPSSPQLSEDFAGLSGRFTMQIGSGGNTSDRQREIWLDDVSLEGDVVDSDDLRLDVPKYLQHNDSSHYSVEANQSGTWDDVTDDATVTPSNTDALTFYSSNNTVVAGENKSINEKVNVTATYDGLTATGSTVVATPTVDNLDLLPAWWSVNALLSDWTVIWILMATLIATAATRMATTFAGIGAFVMAMVMGWIMGDVPNGIMVATTFMGIFIGLNLAANIDYSVR